MWERFTEHARFAVIAAQEAAAELGSDCVRTEHLLLGLCREHEGFAVRALEKLGAEPERFQEAIEARIAKGKPATSTEGLGFSAIAKGVLARAADEARYFQEYWVGTEHLLLALAAEDKGLAAELLREKGISGEQIRAEVSRLLGKSSERGRAAG